MPAEPTVQVSDEVAATESAGGQTEIEGEELGTQAASPKALADAAHATQEAKPSLWPTASQRTPSPTAAEAFDKSDLARSRAFHLFGMAAPLGALVLSILIGGDPLARMLFWVGAGLLAICNAGLYYLTPSDRPCETAVDPIRRTPAGRVAPSRHPT